MKTAEPGKSLELKEQTHSSMTKQGEEKKNKRKKKQKKEHNVIPWTERAWLNCIQYESLFVEINILSLLCILT